MAIGLHPELIDHSRQEGWWFTWLPASPCPEWADMNTITLELNVEAVLPEVSRVMHRADPQSVRTPAQWLRWMVETGLEPPWLKAAYGRRSMLRLLPSDLPPAMNAPAPVAPLRSEHQRNAGRARQARSPAGRAKVRIRAHWQRWRRGEEAHASDAAFARAMCDRYPEQVEENTVRGWARQWRREAGA